MTSPYSQSEFVKIVSRHHLIEGESDPEKVIESHRDFFNYLDKQSSAFYFIHDFVNFKYIMMSKSTYRLLGQNNEEFVGQSFAATLKYFHPIDRENVRFIHEEMFGFLHKQPVPERDKLRFDFNYRILSSEGMYKQILQQTVFTSFAAGNPLFDFSTCTDISHSKKNDTMELAVYKLQETGTYLQIHHYVVPQSIEYPLSTTELQILRYVAEGLSSKEIADKSSRSLHTINTHRKNILNKTKSTTLSEVILKLGL